MENTHSFNSGLSRDLFSLGVSMMQDFTRGDLAPQPVDKNLVAAVQDETFSEGRIHRPNQRSNFKE